MGIPAAYSRLVLQAPSIENDIKRLAPTLWLDASYPGTVTSSSAAVSAWASRVGAVSFAQTTAANKPTLTRADNLENRLTYSEAFTNGIWAKAGHPVTVSGSTMTATASAGLHGTYQAFLPAKGDSYRYVFDLAYNNYQFAVVGSSGGRWHTVVIDLDAGTLGTATNCTAILQTIGTKRYRVTMTFTREDATDAYVEIGFGTASNNTSVPSWTPTGTERIDIYSAQVQSTSASATYLATTTYPQYRGVNNRQAIYFDGSNDGLTVTDFLDTNAFTIISVTRPIATVGRVGRLFDNGKIVYYNYEAGPQLIFSSNASTYANSATTYAAGTTYVATLTRTADGTTNHYIGGLLSGTADQASGAPASATTALVLGNRAALDRPFGGAIGEIIAFNKVLSANDRVKIERYLGRKWGVTIA